MKKRYEINMTKGPLLPELLQFILPLMLSSMLQIAFNAADLIVVGRFGRPHSMAAVGANGAMINLIINVLMGLATGGGVLCARYYGANQTDKLHRTVSTTLITGVIGGVITSALGLALTVPLLRLVGSPDEVLPLATVYLRIYFLGLPVMALYNFSAAALRALGNTRQPLIYLAIAGVLNVVMNLFFVLVVGIDVAGVAIATVLSQCVSGFLTVRCLLTSQELHVKELHFSGHIFKKMMNIGIPAGIQGSLFSISNFIIQASVNSFGAAVIAGNSACVSVEGLLYCPSDAVMQAATTAVSQNVGAQEYERSRSVARWSMVLVVVLTGILTVPAVVFRRQVLGLYTSSGGGAAGGVHPYDDRLLNVFARRHDGGHVRREPRSRVQHALRGGDVRRRVRVPHHLGIYGVCERRYARKPLCVLSDLLDPLHGRAHRVLLHHPQKAVQGNARSKSRRGLISPSSQRKDRRLPFFGRRRFCVSYIIRPRGGARW